MHSSKKIYGSVSVNVPAPYPIIVPAFAMIFLAFLLYGINVDFATLYEVKGYLNTQIGPSYVYAKKPGIISHRFVVNGQKVAKGDALFAIDTAIDQRSSNVEQDMLEKRLLRLDQHIARKSQYLRSLSPLLEKHYVSLSTYQSVRDQLNSLETSKHELRRVLLHHQQAQMYVIQAPISGVVSSLEVQIGQKIGLTQVLVTILPEKTKLIAQLYVPVAKSGFLHSGASMDLHYDAYPYQHFGAAKANIQTISHSILSDRDEVKPIRVGGPYYKVLASLDSQFMVLEGQKHPLQQGMTCTAVIRGAHKKLWQWILDPIHLVP